MLNPPWALFLVVPLGLVPALPGLFLWIIAGAGSIVLSLLLLDVSPKYRGLAFLFAPVIATFTMQQSSPFLLLGFSLFLRFHRSRPFLAGASLLLLAIKPHLFLVFWAVLLVDCIYRRSFIILAGLASALAFSSGISMLAVPNVWQDYLALIRGSALDQNYFPTLPTLFRVLIDVKMAWLALVPASAAVIWGVAYYSVKRQCWEWRQAGMLIMLVTVMTSPYGWVADQVVLLPVVTSALMSPHRKFSTEILFVLNFTALLAISVHSRASIWMPVAWFLWYLYAVRQEGETNLNGKDAEVHPQIQPADFSTQSTSV
jgi:hypothetical protein